MLAHWARLQWKRIRRREFSVLRKPQATRLTCLTSRLKPSVFPLASRGVQERQDRHKVSIVVARRWSSGMLVSAHQL